MATNLNQVMRRVLLLLLLLISVTAEVIIAQQKITLEDVVTKGTFRVKGIPGFQYLQDGSSYLIKNNKSIDIIKIADGSKSGELISQQEFESFAGADAYLMDYQLSKAEDKLVIATVQERIYRHSTKDKIYVFDLNTKQGKLIRNGDLITNATLSPDGSKLAYTFENNLYYTDLSTGAEMQVTKDGVVNQIINGMSDWVYEEEFGFTRAFEWSPDSKCLAFLRFDESKVPEFTIFYNRDEAYPIPYTFKYPKVGQTNSTVSVHFYDLGKKIVHKLNMADDPDIYFPRIKWTVDPSILCVTKMNRHQNDLTLYLANRNDGSYTPLLHETSKQFIDINDYLYFFKDNKKFLWVSDGEGYVQAYLYDMQGKRLQKLTTADADLTDIYGVDEKNGKLYYQVVAPTQMDKQVRVVSLDGKKDNLISAATGYNSYRFSPDFSYAVSEHSDINTPTVYTVVDKKNKIVRTIEDNKAASEKIAVYAQGQFQFFSFRTSEGVSLNGWILKPSNFDSTRKYPVFMTLYGGPGSQTVLNRWDTGFSWWYKYIAEQGYIVACVDNRGTGGRGTEFRKMTYLQLGHYETIDQIEAAKYLGRLPYADASRIGIFGWSYGGFMATSCILKGNDVFKSALAVAPVTNWKWYDSIYTERYMHTEKENPSGYKDNSPVYFADRLKGNYFLAHGLDDDNVHFQNSVEMNRALIKAGKQFEFHMYPNSNHSIYHENARIHLFTAMTNFILEKL